MGILTRYLIRSHAGPFFFALSVLTGLLFLNAVAQRMERLAGKGLGWEVFGEFLILTLPHVVALTLPMAVLVAVLYALSELSSGNEITALSAGGVAPSRIITPLLVAGAILGAGMLYFNAQVLPESNHRLQTLMLDIGSKRPTFELREQLVNEVRVGNTGQRYYLVAQTIDPVTSELTEVMIHDLTDPSRHRTILAERGTMAFTAAGTDLLLTLYDGVVLEVPEGVAGEFQRMNFGRQVLVMEGVADLLERTLGRDGRSDREMTLGMLGEAIAARRGEEAEVREEIYRRARHAVERALLLPPSDETMDPFYSGEETLPSAPGSPILPRTSGGVEGVPERRGLGVQALAAGVTTPGQAPQDPLTNHVAGNVRTAVLRAQSLELQAARYRVEWHKKFSIAAAILIFVLLGAPIALRFPRGGVGMTIAVSVLVFAIYWAGLIGGERLADRGRMNPVLAMWGANALFLAVAIPLLLRMGSAASTTRGGGLDDFRSALWGRMKAPFGWIRREPTPGSEAR